MDSRTLDQVTKEARAWFASEKGEDSLSTAMREVRQMSSDLQKARELKPETLYEPVTL